MPRRPEFRSSVIADLNRQLEWAPEAVRRKRLESAEALIRDIDADRGYPMDFITFRLTGYRPDEAGQEVVVGAALRADLVTMIQVASRGCPLEAGGSRGPLLDLDQVAASFGRSRSGLRSMRDQGLVLWWSRLGDGPLRLAAPDDMLNWFRTAVDVAPGSSRVAGQVEDIERRAAAMASGYGDLVSLSRAVAQDVGCSIDTVRGVLRRAVDAGRLALAKGTRLDDRQGTLILRGVRRGVSATALASRLGIGVPSVHRACRRAQLKRIKRVLASPPVRRSDGEVTEPPRLRWDAVLVPGRDVDVDVESSYHGTAAALEVLAEAVKGCTARSGVDAWVRVEAAVQAMTRHWWGVLLGLTPAVAAALSQWSGRSADTLPAPVMVRVLPPLVDVMIDTVKRSEDGPERLSQRVRAACDRRLVQVATMSDRGTSASGEGVFLIRHTPWRLVLPDPRWERSVDRLQDDDVDFACTQLGLRGQTLTSPGALAARFGTSVQSIVARTAAIRSRLGSDPNC